MTRRSQVKAIWRHWRRNYKSAVRSQRSASMSASVCAKEKQDSAKPEAPRQFGLHLASHHTIQTKKRHVSKVPCNIEALRAKYKVMTNIWFLAQMRHPGRHPCSDVDKDTWNHQLEELLSEEPEAFMLRSAVANTAAWQAANHESYTTPAGSSSFYPNVHFLGSSIALHL